MILRKIKIGKKHIRAWAIPLQSKSFILLKGSRGYIMCGYLNMKAAEKFKDAGIKISGAATIEQALKTKVHSLTTAAKKLGIYKGQPIKDVLKIIV